MWLRFTPLLIAAPLAFIFPFHLAIGAVALFGVWHVISELDYFSARFRIFRRRKTFRPLLFIGAALLAATMLPFSFADFSNARATRLFFILFHSAIALWLVLTLWRRVAGVFSIFALLTVTAAMPLLAAFKPLLLAFLLIHVHNALPWLFYARSRRGFSAAATAAFWGAVFPVGAFVFLSYAGTELTGHSLTITLERDIYEHVMPDLWPWENPVLLLSFFAYQQFLHYLMWIFILPKKKTLQTLPRGEVFSELAFFSGFRKFSVLQAQLVALLLIAGSFALFILFTVEWRRIYFALAQFHVLLEIPLIWLTVNERRAE